MIQVAGLAIVLCWLYLMTSRPVQVLHAVPPNDQVPYYDLPTMLGDLPTMLGECPTPRGVVCTRPDGDLKEHLHPTMNCRHWTGRELGSMGVTDATQLHGCDLYQGYRRMSLPDVVRGVLIGDSRLTLVQAEETDVTNVLTFSVQPDFDALFAQYRKRDDTSPAAAQHLETRYECLPVYMETSTGWQEQVRTHSLLAEDEVLLSERVEESDRATQGARGPAGPRGDGAPQVFRRTLYTVRAPVWERSERLTTWEPVWTGAAEPTLETLWMWRNTTESGQPQRMGGLVRCSKITRTDSGQIWASVEERLFDLRRESNACGGTNVCLDP